MFNTKIIKEKSWIILLFTIFIFSFLLDMYVLTRYNISYGRDGPFYDLQVLNILQTGFPTGIYPPLTYYMLTPFVILSGSSFLGIKIGISFIGSLLVFPAFFLTQTFSEKLNMESKIPALLSAFLITVNTFYFQMIGDFLKNLVGIFFLLFLLYFAVKWLENPKNWKKYGILTTILLACNIFTHIYTGLLAVVLFVSLLLFNLGLRTYKTGKIQGLDLKIVGALSILIISGLVILFTLYPVMLSKFITVLSFLNNSSTDNSNLAGGSFNNPIIFLTLPFLLGILATLNTLYKGLKEKIDVKNQIISKKTLLAWVYIVMTIVLIGLSVAPSVDSQYQSRFIILAFVPIALIVPLGLKFIENWLSKKYPSKKGLKLGLISAIAVIFALSSLYTATGEFSNMGPSITSDQYNNLVQIKENYMPNKIDPNGIIMVDDYHTGYWAQYVLGMQVETGNVSELKEKYPNRTIYAITLAESGGNGQSQLKGDFQYSWNPLLPYSFPFWGLNLSNSQDKLNNISSAVSNQISRNNMSSAPPGGLGNSTGQNRPSAPPNSLGNVTGQNVPNTMPDNLGNVNGQNSGSGSINQAISNYGTLIFSGDNFKIYKIS
jgi:hypothetical protein